MENEEMATIFLLSQNQPSSQKGFKKLSLKAYTHCESLNLPPSAKRSFLLSDHNSWSSVGRSFMAQRLCQCLWISVWDIREHGRSGEDSSKAENLDLCLHLHQPHGWGGHGGQARPRALTHAHCTQLRFPPVCPSHLAPSSSSLFLSLSPDLSGFPLGWPWPLCPATELHEYVCQLVWLHAADPLSDEAGPRPL